MNANQRDFIRTARMNHPCLRRSPRPGVPGTRNHRICYTMPAWLRDGFGSETEYNAIMQKDREEWVCARIARQLKKVV